MDTWGFDEPTARARRYEPPRVVPAGNLRDLVADSGSGILRMEAIEKIEETPHTQR